MCVYKYIFIYVCAYAYNVIFECLHKCIYCKCYYFCGRVQEVLVYVQKKKPPAQLATMDNSNNMEYRRYLFDLCVCLLDYLTAGSRLGCHYVG